MLAKGTARWIFRQRRRSARERKLLRITLTGYVHEERIERHGVLPELLGVAGRLVGAERPMTAQRQPGAVHGVHVPHVAQECLRVRSTLEPRRPSQLPAERRDLGRHFQICF